MTTQTVYGQHDRTVFPTLLRKIGTGVITLFAGLVIMLAQLPLLLLFAGTAVPLPLSVFLAALDLVLIIALVATERVTPLMATAGTLVIAVIAVWLSQVYAATPPITNSNGDPLPNSIATLEQVEINGTQQWVSIRGHDVTNPVLLFLAGGPGGSEIAWTRSNLGALEEHFTVVTWDQPGTGKSYRAVPIEDLTPERYLSDAYALSQYLSQRFEQDKIYVLGESWGSILGVWLVQEHPEQFHAYISSGQMVNTTENDVLGYELALDYLAQHGDTATLERLEANGPPPYTGQGLQMRYMAFLNVLNSYMAEHATGDGQNHTDLDDTLLAPEYGLIDKVNWIRGLSETFTAVYPQLTDLEFRTQVPTLEVPVYIIKGRHDVNASTDLTAEWFSLLEAPHKELIWFEDSGHTPLYEESAHFVDVLVNTVLAGTTN